LAADIDDVVASPWIGLHYKHEFLLHYKHESLELAISMADSPNSWMMSEAVTPRKLRA
jgi:hypothetical protein